MIEYVTHNTVLEHHVIDGDSFSARLYVGDGLAQEKPREYRVFGVDAPELKDQRTHAAALKVRAIVTNWLNVPSQLQAIIKWTVKDKYGRPMSDLYFMDDPRQTLSAFLLDNKLAHPYNGGTKAVFTPEELDGIMAYKG